MSWNIALAVEQEEHHRELRPMVLTRASRGITHSAVIGAGDIVDFSGIHAKITQVVHKHAAAATPEIAPNSVAYATCDPLTDREIEVLIGHGFRDGGGAE